MKLARMSCSWEDGVPVGTSADTNPAVQFSCSNGTFSSVAETLHICTYSDSQRATLQKHYTYAAMPLLLSYLGEQKHCIYAVSIWAPMLEPHQSRRKVRGQLLQTLQFSCSIETLQKHRIYAPIGVVGWGWGWSGG